MTTQDVTPHEAARLKQAGRVIELRRSNAGMSLAEACRQVSAETGSTITVSTFRHWEHDARMVGMLNAEVKQVMAESMLTVMRVMPLAMERLAGIIEDETTHPRDVIAAVKEVRATLSEFNTLTDAMLASRSDEDESDNFDPGFGPVIENRSKR